MRQSWKDWMLRRAVAFVVAAGAMVVLGSAAHSFFVQQAWSSAAGHAYGTAPAAIPFADRISSALLQRDLDRVVGCILDRGRTGPFHRLSNDRLRRCRRGGALRAICDHEERARNGGHFRRSRAGGPCRADGSGRDCRPGLCAAYPSYQPSFAANSLSSRPMPRRAH